jgi:tetratricopeptide (TPR) repeat protein
VRFQDAATRRLVKSKAKKTSGDAPDHGRSTRIATPARAPSAGRKWSFRLAAVIGSPALAFMALELVLRLVGFGYPTSFFQKNPVTGQETMVENRQFSRRYFPEHLMRIPRSLAFSPAKSPETLRVFVFGESAAEGDPSPPFGFGRILQVMLQEQYPQRKTEVINTSVTAVNSHVIRPIARECAGYPADVWVIYMGNNEVVGPFGSGTVFGAQTPSLPLIRANIALLSTRTGQLLGAAGETLARGRTPAAWEGMEMFLKQQVRSDDPRMATVYSHFERNLSDIISFGVHSGAKVVVSTVGCNLKDCAPFASLHRVDLSSGNSAEWSRAYQSGVALESEGKLVDAIGQYERAAQLDDQFADLHFRWARCCAALNQPVEARRHFTLARDLDALRFRADSHINEIIRRVAGPSQADRVRLADAEAALSRESNLDCPGSELFYEHVHLTFNGNYIVARELAEKVVQCLPSETQDHAGQDGFLSREECARRLGLTDWEQLQMEEEMLRRTSRAPFTNQLNHAEDAARRERMIAGLRELDRKNFQASAAAYRQAVASWEGDWQLHDNFAGAALLHGDRTNALEQWRRVMQLLPHRLETYDFLGSILIEEGKPDEAESYYAQSLRIRKDYPEGIIGLGRVRLAQRRFPEAIAGFRRAVALQPDSAQAYNHLGMALLQSENSGEAEAAFRNALRAQPDYMAAALNLGPALLAQGKTDAAITNGLELVRHHPREPAAWIASGKAFAKAGRLEEAVRQYTEAARVQPENYDAQYALGNALIRLNRLGEAADHFSAAVRLRPDSFESHLNYGTILARQQKTSEACAQFEAALQIKPDFVPAHLNLAMALLSQNQSSQAIVHLREVLRLDPGNAAARQLLENSLANSGRGISR